VELQGPFRITTITGRAKYVRNVWLKRSVHREEQKVPRDEKNETVWNCKPKLQGEWLWEKEEEFDSAL